MWKRVGFLQIVGREQHGLAARNHPPDFVPQHAPRFHIESYGRLVEKQQVRIAANGEGEQHSLSLATGKIAKLAITQFLKADGSQDVRGGHRSRVIAGKQIDVFADAQRFRNSAYLQHRTRSHPVFRICGVATENPRSSRIGLQQPQQQLYSGRFARAVRSEQGDDLTRADLKIDSTKRPDVSVIHVDAVETGDDRVQVAKFCGLRLF
jgi:hypothetical protein